MTISIHNVRNAVIGSFLALLLFAAIAPFAHASTYYYPSTYPVTYQTQNSAQVQALLSQVYTLIAQLQSIQKNTQYTTQYTYPQYTVYNPYTPYISPTVTPTVYTYGNYTYGGNYNVDVQTDDAYDQNGGNVTLSGDVELNGASYARVWFEYGKNGNLTQESSVLTVTSDKTFTIDVDDSFSGSHYYYRAVAQDPSGSITYGTIQSLSGNNNSSNNHNSHNNYNTPDVTTYNAENIGQSAAELHGNIDMNDYDNGSAFFVYGESRSEVENVTDENRYQDIDQDGDRLQKAQVDSNVDGVRNFWANIYGLSSNTNQYYRACVEYTDDNDDQTLTCGDVENFRTDY